MSDIPKTVSKRSVMEQETELFGEHFVETRNRKMPKLIIDKFADNLDEFRNQISGCLNCVLGESRTNFVFGSGSPTADLMFVGEAPGKNEDLQGLPFVGRSGNLLDDILTAINLKRTDVYIANIAKCRPPNNRNPLAGEIASCEPYLKHQIDIIKPKLLIALGLVAAKTILRLDESLGNMRGKIHKYHETDLIVTYHPAALLRNPNLKHAAWEDFQKIRDNYLKN